MADAIGGGVERIGLEGYLGLGDFNRSVAQYNKSIEQMTQQTARAAQTMTQTSQAAQGPGGLAGALGGIGTVISGLNPALVVAGVALAATVKVIREVTEAIGALVTQALPMEGVRQGFYALAATAGTSGQEVLAAFRKATGGMVDELSMMQKFNKAASLISLQFATELPEALGYLTKIAASTGESMDYLLNSLITGVGRLSAPIIDNLQVTLSLEDAYDAWAKANDRTTESMSKTEQQAAVMAVVLDQLRVNTAALASPTEMASGAVAALGAELTNLRSDLGETFLPAVQAGATAIRDMVLQIREAIAEGGAWRAGIVEIGAWLKVFVEGIAQMAGAVLNILTDDLGGGFSGFIRFLSDVSVEAFRWGAAIVEMLATGMLEVMDTVLIPVFEALGKAFAYFLAPGSPPRAIPDLDRWGAEAINAYLEGMTKADFGILKAIQTPLKGVLDLFAGQGVIAKEDVAGIYVRLTEGIVQGLTTQGKVAQSVLDELSATTGQYAEEVLALIVAEEELRLATLGIEQAEKDLEASRQGRARSQKALGAAVREYNRLLRAGASKDVLAQQLKAVQISEQELALAEQQESQAEERLDTQKEGLAALREEADLRGQALQEMIALAKMLLPEAAKGGIAGLKDVKDVLDKIAAIEPPKLPVTTFKADFDSLIAAIQDRAREMSNEIGLIMAKLYRPNGPLDQLIAKFKTLAWQADRTAEDNKKAIDDMEAALDPKLRELRDDLQETARDFDSLGIATIELSDTMNIDIIPTFGIARLGLLGLRKAILLVPEAERIWRLSMDNTEQALVDASAAITTFTAGPMDALKSVWENVKSAVEEAIDAVKRYFGIDRPAAPKEEEEEKSPTGSRMATGTARFPGGVALVGELGPELVSLPRGTRIYPARETKDILEGRDVFPPDTTMAARQVGGSSMVKTVNLTFGDVRIANDMDWITFKVGVHKAVLEGIA